MTAAAMPAQDNLARVLADDPGAIVEQVAKEYRVTTREVVEALPAKHAQIRARVGFHRRDEGYRALGRRDPDRPYR